MSHPYYPKVSEPPGGWVVSQPVWTLWRGEKSLSPAGNQTNPSGSYPYMIKKRVTFIMSIVT
jgi:hypothetical protein